MGIVEGLISILHDGCEHTAGLEDKTPAGSEPDYITVDFKALQAKYPDVVGWLYCANTGLNYPIGISFLV